ncbi:type II secretion system F family protein [Microbacterium koreense]|uniref:Type II secretion system F family protein n=1 Tax=Microbacterium koreense TaxID=323761 RepID=A0ABW2ZRG4_9MICO
MTFVWGALLASGILLTVSPWVWPTRAERSPGTAARRVSGVLDEAGLSRVTPVQLVLSSVLAGALAAAVTWLTIPVGVVAILAAVVGTATPSALVRARRARLLRVRRGLWPDVCDLLIASVRAGMSLPDAVAALADSAPAQVRPAFRAFAHDLAASGHFDSSILRLKANLADPVADRIVETVRMARQVGGSELTSVLRALAASVRADAAVRAELDARQSWIRGAAVLGVVAPWVVLGLLALRPEGARAYGTPEGMVLIIGGAVVSFVAYRLMRHLGRLPDMRRWFA